MVFPQIAHTDRDISLKEKPGSKPPEERKNIRSARSAWVDPRSNNLIRLESKLEGDAAMMLALEQGVVSITSQFGPVWFWRDGEWHHTIFDLCVQYASGRRRLIAVKRKDRSAQIKGDLQLIRNQTLHFYAHSVELWTEKKITKPAVKRADYILNARRKRNSRHVAAVYAALHKAGGVARVIEIVDDVEGMERSHGWDAVWSLIDEGHIVHDHPKADTTGLEYHSFVRIVGS